MNISPHTLLFFDAACLIAAAGSPTGGSGFLLSLCTRALLRGAVSQTVLLEVEQNILTKMSSAVLDRYVALLQTVPLTIVPSTEWAEEPWTAQVNPKDHHVVAAALAAHCPFLLTLDRPLLAEIARAGIPLEAMTPGDFIRDMLPTHSDFARLR